MPSTIISRHPFPPDLSTNPFLSSHSAMKDLSPILFDDTSHFDSPISDCDQMIFGPLEFDEGTHYKPLSTFPWDPYAEFDSPPFITSNFSGPSPSSLVPFDHVNVPPPPPTNIFHDPGPISSSTETQPTWLHDHDDNDFYLSHWLNEPDLSLVQVSSSLPTTSRSYTHELQRPSSCVPFPQQSSQDSSPVFAALNALPRSTSPTTSFDDYMAPQSQPLDSVSPQDTSLQTPAWASHLWETSSYLATPTSPQLHSSPLPANPRRRRTSMRRDSLPGQTFQPSSAPSALHNRPVNLARSYSRRAESASVSDDRDATIRRKRRISDEPRSMEKTSDSSPSRSLLKPPKLAPSAWQLYFTDWIQKQQASSTRKLNVAQAAKEAGQEYAGLSPEEKEPYKRRSQAAKEAREQELAAYMRTLTPDDIKRENAFRTAQRKAGKSRKSNIKDPNAPKKPLSAYFMFLQRIRSDPFLVQEVFGDETETTKQSVLAAAKWRSMTDDERKPFLAKAEQEKLDYEAARRLYEEGTVSDFGSSINFSILPGNPTESVFRIRGAATLEPASSESESDELMTDDGMGIRF